ncbi:class I SAM-dependent methyltransferase [Sungkyunkwania multivorans]|uniref:Class I SAM-dependent methyltransferase n=1 Tax=Sungkyunkwania multivorans TaxID=1173618 RepID=A0ABW3D012_9FLAO
MVDHSNEEIFLSCKDHTVSGEIFQLLKNKELDMLVTSPKPTAEKLPSYYQSEDYISHTDAKRSIFEKVYHLVKKYALAKKVRTITRYQKQKGQLLDIGAGTGDFLREAKKRGWDIAGIEPDEQARALAGKKGIELQKNTQHLDDECFDAITMWHVLEHVPDLEKQILELKRLLKKDGTIFIAVPNFNSYDANHYKEFWAAYDVPRHLWHFSKKSIAILFEKYQMQIIQILPMKFDAYYVSLLSEKYKTGKMNTIKAFLTGVKSNLTATSSGEYSSLIYIIEKKELGN